MPDKSEKERRRQIMEDILKKKDEEFESSLPMSRGMFKSLFDFLDIELENSDCDNSLKLSHKFLASNQISNLEDVLEWLRDHGGGCDCEVLANIEDSFE